MKYDVSISLKFKEFYEKTSILIISLSFYQSKQGF